MRNGIEVEDIHVSKEAHASVSLENGELIDDEQGGKNHLEVLVRSKKEDTITTGSALRALKSGSNETISNSTGTDKHELDVEKQAASNSNTSKKTARRNEPKLLDEATARPVGTNEQLTFCVWMKEKLKSRLVRGFVFVYFVFAALFILELTIYYPDIIKMQGSDEFEFDSGQVSIAGELITTSDEASAPKTPFIELREQYEFEGILPRSARTALRHLRVGGAPILGMQGRTCPNNFARDYLSVVVFSGIGRRNSRLRTLMREQLNMFVSAVDHSANIEPIIRIDFVIPLKSVNERDDIDIEALQAENRTETNGDMFLLDCDERKDIHDCFWKMQTWYFSLRCSEIMLITRDDTFIDFSKLLQYLRMRSSASTELSLQRALLTFPADVLQNKYQLDSRGSHGYVYVMPTDMLYHYHRTEAKLTGLAKGLSLEQRDTNNGNLNEGMIFFARLHKLVIIAPNEFVLNSQNFRTGEVMLQSGASVEQYEALQLLFSNIIKELSTQYQVNSRGHGRHLTHVSTFPNPLSIVSEKVTFAIVPNEKLPNSEKEMFLGKVLASISRIYPYSIVLLPSSISRSVEPFKSAMELNIVVIEVSPSATLAEVKNSFVSNCETPYMMFLGDHQFVRRGSRLEDLVHILETDSTDDGTILGVGGEIAVFSQGENGHEMILSSKSHALDFFQDSEKFVSFSKSTSSPYEYSLLCRQVDSLPSFMIFKVDDMYRRSPSNLKPKRMFVDEEESLQAELFFLRRRLQGDMFVECKISSILQVASSIAQAPSPDEFSLPSTHCTYSRLWCDNNPEFQGIAANKLIIDCKNQGVCLMGPGSTKSCQHFNSRSCHLSNAGVTHFFQQISDS